MPPSPAPRDASRGHTPSSPIAPFGHLLVLGCEVGGRWNDDSKSLVRALAKHRARAAPRLLQRSARLAWEARWWGMLSVGLQIALCTTLSGEGHLALSAPAGQDEVPLEEALDGFLEAPSASRLPLR